MKVKFFANTVIIHERDLQFPPRKSDLVVIENNQFKIQWVTHEVYNGEYFVGVYLISR